MASEQGSSIPPIIIIDAMKKDLMIKRNFASMKKIRVDFISNYVNCNTPPPPPLPPSPSTDISSRLHRSPLSRLAPSTDRSRPLSSPPPPSRRVAYRRVASRRVVPRPRLSRLRRRSEGTAASPHPSPSRRRRGKIPSIVVVLRSDDDASRRPPPPLVAPSNICSRSRQRDNIAAPAIVAAARPSLRRTPPQRFC